MRLRNSKAHLAAFAALTAAVTATALPASAATPRLPISPKVGKPRTTFVTTFVARYPTSQGAGEAAQFFYYEGRGPGSCREFGLGEADDHSVGERVKLRIEPSSIGELGERKTWCPGRYSGKVTWMQTDESGTVQKQRSVGRFSFIVKR